TQESQYDQLRSSADTLHRLLQQQLLAAGYRVATLNRDAYTRLWQQEAEAVGGVYQKDSSEFKGKEYLQALKSLIQKSCVHTECDLILEARLVTRPASISNGYLEWDGRRRAQPDAGESGTAYGISVELSGITADGELAFKH